MADVVQYLFEPVRRVDEPVREVGYGWKAEFREFPAQEALRQTAFQDPVLDILAGSHVNSPRQLCIPLQLGLAELAGRLSKKRSRASIFTLSRSLEHSMPYLSGRQLLYAAVQIADRSDVFRPHLIAVW